MTFDESWVFLMNHDQPLIKWWMWPQNVDVNQKSWGLTVCWPQLSFYPIQLIFNHLNHWLSKLVMQGLKLGMRFLGDIRRTMNPIWDLGNPIFLEKYKTLVMSPLLRRRIYLINSWATLSIWEFLENVLNKMRGKILGYNIFPCSIFLNLKS